MRRRTLAVLVLILLVAGLALAHPGWSFSDGVAGASGQIEEHLRKCQGTEYCKVTPSYCGSCHGGYSDMWEQEGSNPTPQERVGKLTFTMNGDRYGGQLRGGWEYTPGQVFTIEIKLPDERPRGQFNSGGFNLNASAGQLAKVAPDDDTVRITGGLHRHAGTKNPAIPTFQGQTYGETETEEHRYAGEATHTAKGAEVRTWRVKWTAPRAGTEPRGVALVMTAMLPDGNDGVDTCIQKQCNSTLGKKPQSEWDWYGFMIPRRILCERDAYLDFATCQKRVLAHILPPAPPVDTGCGPENPECLTDPDDGTRGTPGAGAAITFAAALAVATARRPRFQRR